MDYGLYLDLLMIVLLIATIIYAMILSRRLAAFRRNREEMENFLAAFNAANERAEISIRGLKEMAEQSGEKLREDIERASALNEDLSFMADRGESIANRLEKAASEVNTKRRAAPGAGAGAGIAPAGAPAMSPAAPQAGMPGAGGREIIDDRIGIETRAEELAARMVRDVERGNTGPSGPSPLAAALNAGGFGDMPRPGAGGHEPKSASLDDPFDADEDAGRSEAERELLAALRSVR